jgi:hypothetical protein
MSSVQFEFLKSNSNRNGGARICLFFCSVLEEKGNIKYKFVEQKSAVQSFDHTALYSANILFLHLFFLSKTNFSFEKEKLFLTKRNISLFYKEKCHFMSRLKNCKILSKPYKRQKAEENKIFFHLNSYYSTPD